MRFRARRFSQGQNYRGALWLCVRQGLLPHLRLQRSEAAEGMDVPIAEASTPLIIRTSSAASRPSAPKGAERLPVPEVISRSRKPRRSDFTARHVRRHRSCALPNRRSFSIGAEPLPAPAEMPGAGSRAAPPCTSRPAARRLRQFNRKDGTARLTRGHVDAALVRFRHQPAEGQS